MILKKISWIECVLAALCVVGGAMLAVGYLVVKPVATVNQLPPESARSASLVYFVQGSRDATRSASWVNKRRLLIAAQPGQVVLNEDELNAWFSASTHVKQARKAAGRGGAELVTIGQPDFHIADGMLRVAAPSVAHLLGCDVPVIVQLRGTFERTQGAEAADAISTTTLDLAGTGVVMFMPKEVYVGSLPLHRIPGATEFLLREMLSRQALPGEVVMAWRKIDRVSILGRELHVIVAESSK